MKKAPLSFAYCLFFCLCLYAQSPDALYQQHLQQKINYTAQHFLDNLVVKNTSKIDVRYQPFPNYYADEVKMVLDSNLRQFETEVHPLVLNYIDFWANQPMDKLRSWISINHYYSPTISPILKEFHVPESLRYLPFSLSNLIATASSSEIYAGAWEMPEPVALAMGVQVTAQNDERYSLNKSTIAAAKYLQKLYARYKNWTLATTAFVCGAAALNKAIIQSKEATSFWEIYPFLPKNTRDFYPALLASIFVLNRPNWKPVPYPLQLAVDLKPYTSEDTLVLAQITEVLGIDKDWFVASNPTHKSNVFYPNETFNIPFTCSAPTSQNIAQFKHSLYFPKTEDSCYVFYTTKKGDYFSDLTRWFTYSLEEIKSMNALSSNVLRRNTDIFFRVPVKDSLKYAQFNQLSNNEKNAVSGHSDYIPPKPQAPKIITAPTGKLIYYTIKSGDTLWDIAQKYNTSYQKIQAWNNIGENLQLGQKIKIYLEDK